MCEAELIVVYDGIDESTSNNVQCRWSYLPKEIMFGYDFVPVLSKQLHRGGGDDGLFGFGGGDGGGGGGDGMYVIDTDRFHDVVPTGSGGDDRW